MARIVRVDRGHDLATADDLRLATGADWLAVEPPGKTGSDAVVTPTSVAIDPSVHARRWWTLAVLCLSLLLIVAGNSALNVALPSIQEALGSSQSELQW